MAALDEVRINRGAATNADLAGIDPAVFSIVKSYIAAELWKWFAVHQNQAVKTINFWFIHRTIYVRDLRQVFVLILGPDPATGA